MNDEALTIQPGRPNSRWKTTYETRMLVRCETTETSRIGQSACRACAGGAVASALKRRATGARWTGEERLEGGRRTEVERPKGERRAEDRDGEGGEEDRPGESPQALGGAHPGDRGSREAGQPRCPSPRERSTKEGTNDGRVGSKEGRAGENIADEDDERGGNDTLPLARREVVGEGGRRATRSAQGSLGGQAIRPTRGPAPEWIE